VLRQRDRLNRHRTRRGLQVHVADSPTLDPQYSLRADVGYWLAHPAQNFGWILLGDEANPPPARRFQSRENDTTQVGEPTMDVNGVKTESSPSTILVLI